MLKEQLKTAFLLLIVLSVITGIFYPLVVTGIAQAFFHKEANGSLMFSPDGKIIGSSLIGQNFDDPKYFWGRLSATTPAYNASASSGSNLGPSNPTLIDTVKSRIATLKAADPENSAPIPVDLVTACSSGLDPHLSLAGAYYQVSRVARLRNLSEKTVKDIVGQNTSGRFLGLLGEPVVNILKVNLTLDQFKK
jgi:potassium-transporting ATPase KdpC subunit